MATKHPNKTFTRSDGITEIYVTRRDGTQHTILVDSKDFQDYDLESYRWFVWKNKHGYCFYALTRREGKAILMHRLLLDSPTGKLQPDHIDRNGLNNCRSNLRLVTGSQNCSNRRLRKDNPSGYKGVRPIYRNKAGVQKYRVDVGRTVQLGKTMVTLGTFDDPIKAAEARDLYVLRIFKDCAWLNFPEKRAQYEMEINKEAV
jgi:hypothetical protein